LFEANWKPCRQIPAAFGLTASAAMHIKDTRKGRAESRAQFRCHIADSRIEAHRRGWMIHLRDVAVRGPGALRGPFFIS
jgi:hypothetical protein